MTEEVLESGAPRVEITREFLLDGQFLRDARVQFGDAIISDEDIDMSLGSVLEGRPAAGPIWVFAYGSLMWNPAFLFDDRKTGSVAGWHRRFCIRVPYGRGTEEYPGLTLALDAGGSVDGVVFKLPEGQELAEMLLIWRREMFGKTYVPVWVDVTIGSGSVRAITFKADTSHPAYAGGLSDDEVAEILGMAGGVLGTAREYFDGVMAHLDGLRIEDEGMERLRGLVYAPKTEVQVG